MTKSLDLIYYEWLVDQIDIRSDRTYGYLFERMHNTEFFWTVPKDDNRIQDGEDLRYELLDYRARSLELQFVTTLEVLIGLSRRVEFQVGGSEKLWAWRLLKNLRLNKMSDPITPAKEERIGEILDALIWRTYSPNGQGGFFPLKNPKKDQTKVEIWEQMQAYIIEIPF